MKPTITIEPAKALEQAIHEKTKQEKFDSMIKWQIDSIRNSMAEYRNGCNFIFDDSTQYRRDFEQVWKEEF